MMLAKKALKEALEERSDVTVRNKLTKAQFQALLERAKKALAQLQQKETQCSEPHSPSHSTSR